MATVSVIVPVYKVEAYLPYCVDSILAQSFSDFELILVDDGSPDRCGEICDEYAKRDPRIRVIHQENRGLSGARNAGLDIAAGNDICFIDSDDAVAPDYLAVLYKALIETGSDIAAGLLCQIDFSDAEPPGTAARVSFGPGKEFCRSLYPYGGLQTVNAFKLYRADLWKEQRFPVGKIHEDQAVIPKLIYQTARCVTVYRRMYGYRINPQGITYSAFSNRHFDDIDALDDCIQFFRERNELEIVEVAEKRRLERIGAYVLDAYREHKENQLPPKYRMSKQRALKYLRKAVPHESYLRFLSRNAPNQIIPYRIMRKVKQLFGCSEPQYYQAKDVQTVDIQF